MKNREWMAERLDGVEEGWVKLASPLVMPTSCSHCLLSHYHGVPLSISSYFSQEEYEGFVERNTSLLTRILEAVGRNKAIDYLEINTDSAVVIFRGSKGTTVPEYQSVVFEARWYGPRKAQP
jgi:hypothetical protein